MIPNRRSEASSKNPRLIARTRRRNETASAWVRRHGGRGLPGSIVLLGGQGLVDFRLRVAQSHVRHDLKPSHWSHAALITKAPASGDISLLEIALTPAHGFGEVPVNNGVQEGRLSVYDDRTAYPNLAWLSFGTDMQRLEQAVAQFRHERHLIDIPTLLVEWLRFAWGAGAAGNPLLREQGIPSAAFLEGIFGLVDAELSPGLSSVSSCPEAIWQAAKWWHGFYEAGLSDAVRSPRGAYNIGHRLGS